MSSHFLGSRTSARKAVTWEDKFHNLQYPSFLLLSLSFYCEHYGIEYPFGEFGLSCPGFIPLPGSYLPPAYLLVGQSEQQRRP